MGLTRTLGRRWLDEHEDYEKDRKKRMGADAETPHWIRYRKIEM